jgi:AhpD family alkylhydroperoxidase
MNGGNREADLVAIWTEALLWAFSFPPSPSAAPFWRDTGAQRKPRRQDNLERMKAMKPRLDYFAKAPELMQTVLALNKAVEESGLEMNLLHLIKLRASQINGCSYCVDMHSREARENGESEQRLYLVAAWKESPLFTERERAAFAWAEAVTLISQGGVSDELYAATLKHFTEEELVKLTVAVTIINTWNRLSVSFHSIHPVRTDEAT